MQGLDKNRCVRNVVFDSIMINGVKMKHLKGIIKNEFIEDIEIK